MKQEVDTFWCKIYIAGDYDQIVQLCRRFCFDFPYCVTITPTTYVYHGGIEDGVEIGLINYPRFPRSNAEILDITNRLADKVMIDQGQLSYSIVTPDKTYRYTRREEECSGKTS